MSDQEFRHRRGTSRGNKVELEDWIDSKPPRNEGEDGDRTDDGGAGYGERDVA